MPQPIWPGRTIEVPSVQNVQLPAPRGIGTTLVANLDATYSVDLCDDSRFPPQITFTLGATESANWPASGSLWCRVTPDQTGAPASVTIWAQPGGTAAPAAVVRTSPANVTITTTALPGATVGTAYSATLAATGGTTPYTWSLSSGTLPPGLSLSSGGAITGTPTTADAYTFTVEVTDATGGTSTQPLSINVTAGPTQKSVTFAYTGTTQTWTVPSGVTSITVDLAGGAGGTWSGGANGGLGGRVQGTLSVTAGDVLTIDVAGAGVNGSGTIGGSGGYGGGGTGQNGPTDYYGSGGGGGASSILTSTGTSLAIAAGGGGSGGDGYAGGAGGGTSGAAGGVVSGGVAAGGGTQTAGGAGGSYSGSYAGSAGTAGAGGAGAIAVGTSGPTAYPGGGGGGGYYGGGGGCSYYAGGGGGGSSLVPSGGTTTSGYQAGNGYVTITYTT